MLGKSGMSYNIRIVIFAKLVKRTNTISSEGECEVVTVTQRIKQIQQPWGGYINPKIMHRRSYDDGLSLNEEVSLMPTTMGLVVDYMTRFMITHNVLKAFDIPIKGAKISGLENLVTDQLESIKGLDDDSINAATRIILAFDSTYRTGNPPDLPLTREPADEETIDNIKIMVERSLAFFKKVGPITATEFTFEGGYTKIVNNADADYLTEQTIWDMKVSKYAPRKENTLQLVLYYLLAKRSKQERYKEITSLGIFNPKQNKSYLLNIDEVDADVLQQISEKVLGAVY